MSGGEFAAIEDRANAATEGPWAINRALGESQFSVGSANEFDVLDVDSDQSARPSAEFIAHAREDIPALLAALRERDNTIAKVRELHQPRVNSTSALYPKPLCSCNSTYPCDTIAALDPQETP
ncbi:hypothetical protein [Rhodococcoides fascians]|uniref:hypothetical protein n=1 Tax=Rhodococcoides fascians TaxID=1828 RepID=UPI00050BDDA0|nr:hypothetical protein [Rhodococcus fascians]